MGDIGARVRSSSLAALKMSSNVFLEFFESNLGYCLLNISDCLCTQQEWKSLIAISPRQVQETSLELEIKAPFFCRSNRSHEVNVVISPYILVVSFQASQSLYSIPWSACQKFLLRGLWQQKKNEDDCMGQDMQPPWSRWDGLFCYC